MLEDVFHGLIAHPMLNLAMIRRWAYVLLDVGFLVFLFGQTETEKLVKGTVDPLERLPWGWEARAVLVRCSMTPHVPECKVTCLIRDVPDGVTMHWHMLAKRNLKAIFQIGVVVELADDLLRERKLLLWLRLDAGCQ